MLPEDNSRWGLRAETTRQRRPCHHEIPYRRPIVTSLPGQLVEGDVKFQDVDPRLAEEPERPAQGVLARQAFHFRKRQVPGRGDPGLLVGGVLRGDVRVESRA